MSRQKLILIPGLIATAATVFVAIAVPPGGWFTPSSDSTPLTATRSSAEALFEDATAQSGIEFLHVTETPGSYFFPEIVSSGCALLDFDADGDLDVYLINLGTGYGDGRSDALNNTATNRLYEQYAPLKFRDVTERSGLGDRGYGMGVAVGDINNDGRIDVYVTNYGPDRLYLNQGDGRFVEITAAAGIDNPLWGTSASFVDFDQDGWLDLFVTNYVDYFPRPCVQLSGVHQEYCAPHVFPATSDKLYRNVTAAAQAASGNDGSTVRFQDVSSTAGISRARGPGLGVAVFDFTDDGRPDIYVANDQTANVLWVNRGDGTFEDEAVLQGVAYDSLGRPQAGMGVALGDVNGDSTMELFITHFEGEHNALYGRSGPVYSDHSMSVGLGKPSFQYTGFGAAMLDIELDGDLDVVVANGRVKRFDQGHAVPAVGTAAGAEVHEFWNSYSERNQVFLNSATGQFAEYHSASDPFVSASFVSRGLASGDIDNDGDIDLIVTNTGGPAQLFVNSAERHGNWLQIRVRDPALGGRDVYGTIVTVAAAGGSWVRLVNPGLGYLSSSDPRVHFGLGATPTIERIDVKWPDGKVESFPGGPSDREITLVRGEGQADG